MFRLLPTAVNYEHPNEPVFSGAYATTPPAYNGRLKIVSYNINFGLTFAEASAEINSFNVLSDVDILLLQEMDESGTEVMAQMLGMNYVYYPASVHNQHGRNFGNAILTRWPLYQPQKIILPHKSWYNQQIRIAVRGRVRLPDTDLLVYCAHTEVYTAPLQFRRAQVQAIVDNVRQQDHAHIIVGGDFNTVTRRGIRRMERQFATAEMERASKGSGSTISKFGPTAIAADHLFVRGGVVLARGTVTEASASDHYPVWAQISLGEDE